MRAPADTVGSQAEEAAPTLAKPPVLLEEVPAETTVPAPELAVELDLVVDKDGSIREASVAQGEESH